MRRFYTYDYLAVVLVAFMLLALSSCKPYPAPIPPPVSDAIYQLPLTMLYNSAALRYSVHFEGQLPYTYPSGCIDEPFSFADHPLQQATLEVWIGDTAGLQPGERFEYKLPFDRPGGFTQETFTLVAQNPLAGPPRLYDFYYVINLNAADPNLRWLHPGVPIAGDYSIVTDRAMNVTLKFTLRKTVNGAPGPTCGLPR